MKKKGKWCEKMLMQSDVTGINYHMEDVVHFRNFHQSCFYLNHKARLVDLFCDSSGKLVFVFWRSEHENLIKLWMDNKNKNEE